MTTTATSIPFSPNGDIKTAIDFDSWLDTPDQVQDQADESSHISAKRIAAAIDALAPVIEDLDYQHKLAMLMSFKDRIADIPADERGPIEAPVLKVVKTGQAADEFWSKIPAPSAGPVFAPFSFDDLLAMPPKEWIIDQVVGASDIGVIYGMPGCGKTFVGIDMIMAACTGSLWAMRFVVARRLNVAYCAGEGISGLPARFKAAAHHHGVTKLPNFTFFRTVPQLFSSEADATIATIRQFVAEWKARQEQKQAEPLDLVFIDTLHTATVAADENSAQDMGKVLHACRWASNELGCAIVLVHHTTKNGTTERGSSALRGAADFMIEVRRLSDAGTKAIMHCSKLKDGEQWSDQGLDLVSIDGFDSVRVWWDDPSNSPTSRENTKQKQDIEAIAALLSAKPGIRYPANSIAESIGMKGSKMIYKLIGKAAEQDERITSGLKNPDKDASPSNPMMYWYKPEPAKNA